MNIFVVAWFIFAFIYSVLAAFTKVFYKGKHRLDLSNAEADILYGRATFFTKFAVLVTSLFNCLKFPPVYILAILATVIYVIAFGSMELH
jgi:hypothetical protein